MDSFPFNSSLSFLISFLKSSISSCILETLRSRSSNLFSYSLRALAYFCSVSETDDFRSRNSCNCAFKLFISLESNDSFCYEERKKIPPKEVFLEYLKISILDKVAETCSESIWNYNSPTQRFHCNHLNYLKLLAPVFISLNLRSRNV